MHDTVLVRSAIFDDSGQTEVRDHSPSVGIDQNVAWLQVSMHDPLSMNVVHRHRHVSQMSDDFVQIGLHVQRFCLDVLQHQEGPSIVVGQHIVNAHYMGMPKLRQRGCFTQKPGRAGAGRFVDHPWRLDGHTAPEFLIPSFVYRPERTLAEDLLYDIAANSVSFIDGDGQYDGFVPVSDGETGRFEIDLSFYLSDDLESSFVTVQMEASLLHFEASLDVEIQSTPTSFTFELPSYFTARPEISDLAIDGVVGGGLGFAASDCEC